MKNSAQLLYRELCEWRKKGVKLLLENRESDPGRIVRAHQVAEYGAYMRDYIFSRNGRVSAICFTCVGRKLPESDPYGAEERLTEQSWKQPPEQPRRYQPGQPRGYQPEQPRRYLQEQPRRYLQEQPQKYPPVQSRNDPHVQSRRNPYGRKPDRNEGFLYERDFRTRKNRKDLRDDEDDQKHRRRGDAPGQTGR